MEVAVCLLLTGVVISAVIGPGGRSFARARQERALREMSAIADAAVLYRSVNGVWTENVLMLPGYLSGSVAKDPWGGEYQIRAVDHGVRVSCWMPGTFAASGRSGVLMEVSASGSGNNVSVTRPLSFGRAGRLILRSSYGTSK